MILSKILILLPLIFTHSAFSETTHNCSSKSVQNVISNLESELKHSKSPSLSFQRYSEIDSVMMCDIQEKLAGNDRKKVLNILNEIKKSKPTPFAWASSDGVNIWEDGISNLTFLPQEIRKNLPIILSQLNSSIIAFVPSENGDRSTNYNFESDLDIDLFGPWDRRNCEGIPKDELLFMKENLETERISKQESSNFTRNYSAIEVSKIAVHKSPTCFWYENTNKVVCQNEFTKSIVHEALHLLETRYPLFIKALHSAKGGYQDRLKLAQETLPEFGVTKCTPDSWEEHCSDGPISYDEAKIIALKTLPPQDTGSIAKKHYARKLNSNNEALFCSGDIKEQAGEKFCVENNFESLYSFVRGGEEYISVLLEKAIVDPEQFNKVASDEEKRLFKILKNYIF